MTAQFIADLCDRPDFGRIYLCSPWISFEPVALRNLSYAIAKAESHSGNRVQILAITRPGSEDEGEVSGARQLMDMGAEVVFKQRLHSKLYIREPSLRGGVLAATFGSENLTRSRYLELGIHIRNDSELVGRLIEYFFDVYGLPLEV